MPELLLPAVCLAFVSELNAKQFLFNSFSENYDPYLGLFFFEPYALELVQRFNPSHVNVALELASGTGRVTKHLRRALPSSTWLTGSDLSSDMLAVAKRRLEGEDIEWRSIDAQALPFKDSSIDLIVCSFGYMFVLNKADAFAEAFRVLRPGGTLLFSTWDTLENNPASHIFRKTVQKYLAGALPASYRLPFSMADANLAHLSWIQLR